MTTSNFNFLGYQSDFEKDTGVKIKDNMSLYISYCQMRQLANLNTNTVGAINALYNNLKLDFKKYI